MGDAKKDKKKKKKGGSEERFDVQGYRKCWRTFGPHLFRHWRMLSLAMLGMVLSIVFQLAHVVNEAEFPLPVHGTGKMDNAWAVHQTCPSLCLPSGKSVG